MQIDNTPPVVFNCPQSSQYTVSVGGAMMRCVTWIEPTYFDESAVQVTQSHNPGACFPIGSTDVTYTFTDEGGNVATCVFTITGNVFSNCAF